MKKVFVYVSLILLIVSSFSCTESKTKTFNSVTELIEAKKSEVNFINASELKSIITSGEKIQLIDCRETIEFDSVCIKGAINIPRGLLESEISNKAPKHRQTIYVYCSDGNRSILAASVLPKLKYADVRVLKGGFENWKNECKDLVELHPVRGGKKTETTAKPSGGCGG